MDFGVSPHPDVAGFVQGGEARIRDSTLPLLGLPTTWDGYRSIGRTEWSGSSEPGGAAFELIELHHACRLTEPPASSPLPDELSVTVMSRKTTMPTASVAAEYAGTRKHRPQGAVVIKVDDDYNSSVDAYAAGDWIYVQLLVDQHLVVLSWPRAGRIPQPLWLTRKIDLSEYLEGRRRRFRDLFPELSI